MAELSTISVFLQAVKDEFKRCQSCGMPLRLDKNYKRGNLYCGFCHDGKSFTDGNLTRYEMITKINRVLKEKNKPSIIRYYVLARIFTLKRWLHF